MSNMLPPNSLHTSPSPLFREYADAWIQARAREGLRSVTDYARCLRNHVLPVFGSQPIVAIERRHVRRFVAELGPRANLAPLTVRNVWRVFAQVLGSAEADGLIGRSPAVLIRGDLPRLVQTTGLGQAVYTRSETEALLFEPERICPPNRMAIRILLLTGLRIGELSALSWSRLDVTRTPLHLIDVAHSWRPDTAHLGPTKTGVARLVPVHPLLAKWLAEWRLGGWHDAYGQVAGAEDLVVPDLTRAGDLVYLDHRRLAERLRRICRTLGIEYRAIHPMRATFISLAQEDGALPDILERVTHRAPRRVFSGYSRFSWESLCREVAKLRLARPGEMRGQLELPLEEPPR